MHNLPENAWGLELQLDLFDCSPLAIRSADGIRSYVITLCELINMRRFGEPTIIHFGDEERVAGFSMTQLIETSLVSGHFANATNAAYLNIFSCQGYDENKVVEFSRKWFNAQSYNHKLTLRLNGPE